MPPDIETAVAEMSGIRMCAAPSCFRQLKNNQGKVTGKHHTCFSPTCVEWAKRMTEIAKLS